MRISRRASAISPFYAMEYGRRAAELIADGHDVIIVISAMGDTTDTT